MEVRAARSNYHHEGISETGVSKKQKSLQLTAVPHCSSQEGLRGWIRVERDEMKQAELSVSLADRSKRNVAEGSSAVFYVPQHPQHCCQCALCTGIFQRNEHYISLVGSSVALISRK